MSPSNSPRTLIALIRENSKLYNKNKEIYCFHSATTIKLNTVTATYYVVKLILLTKARVESVAGSSANS